jgi:PAS domain S-box-containing protein
MNEFGAQFGQVVAEALDKSDDLVLVLQRSGTARGVAIAGLNDAFCRASGYAHAELVGRPFQTLLAETASTGVVSKTMETVASGGSLHAELLCKRRNGSYFWFGFHLMPAGDPIGSGGHFVVLGRDITAKLLEGEQQRAMQELLASVFACVDAAVSIASEEGRFLMSNPKMGQLLGCIPTTLDGSPVCEIFAPRCRDEFEHARHQQLLTSKTYSLALTVLRADGSEILASLTAATVCGHGNRRFSVLTLTPESKPTAISVQVAGKLQMIGLEEVKQVLGPRWPALVDRVMQGAENVIRRRIGPRDTYARTDDQGFLVCFSGICEQEASFRAAMIAREIRKKLIGEGNDGTVAHVTAVTTTLPIPSEPPPASGELTRIMNARLQSNLSVIHDSARRTLKSAMRDLQAFREPVLDGRQGEAAGHYICLPPEMERQVVAALAALPAAEVAEFDLDALRLTMAIESCTKSALAGSTNPVFVELVFDLFDARGRTERYLALLAKLDARLQRRLLLMFSQLPTGLARMRLDDCMQRVRPYCRQVGIKLEDLSLEPHLIKGMTGTILEVDAQDWKELPDAQLSRILGTIHAQGIKLLVRRVTSRDAAVTLRTLGVDLLSVQP